MVKSQGYSYCLATIPWFLAGVALLCLGMLVGVDHRIEAGDDPPDPRPPLPPTLQDGRKDYRVPNPDRAIFRGFLDPKSLKRTGGIVDFTPVASEKENSDEYQAWHELILHAWQFDSKELLDHARRDIVRDELVESSREALRLELIRLDGRLVQARRVEPTATLQRTGIFAVYEAILEPLDEPPQDWVSLVFTECPEALQDLATAPVNAWKSYDHLWASGAGYFFKVKPDPTLPILIGKGLQVTTTPPPGPDPQIPPALDRQLRIFRRIENDTWVARSSDRWEEAVAYNRVLLHARRWSTQELEEFARRDLRFADLYFDGHRELSDGRRDFRGSRSYLLELVRLEGRLVMLRSFAATRKLQQAGIDTLYEGWLIPQNEPRGNPVCLVFTELPEGMEAGGRTNYWVSFAGYYFKLMRYESAERSVDDPSRFVVKRAPLLLGRSVILRPDPEAASPVSWAAFSRTATVVIVGLVLIALGLTWWYRREDRRIRDEIAQQQRNPFETPGKF
jgi:hypothetical protein